MTRHRTIETRRQPAHRVPASGKIRVLTGLGRSWHAVSMWVARHRIEVRLRAPVARALLGTVLAVAWAGPSSGQSGTLQAPVQGSRPPPAVTTPPAAAPRQPVHPTPATTPRPAQPTAPRPAVASKEARPALPLPLPPPPPPPPPEAQSGVAPSTGGVVAGPAEPGKPAAEGLPLPRFASLKSDQVNLRAGPGTRYPIQWVYNRRELDRKSVV